MNIIYKPIIAKLSAKNKYYRWKNEKLVSLMYAAAENQAELERARGCNMEEYNLLSNQMKRKADAVFSCGTFLGIKIENGITRISGGNFCRDKLCALCAKNRSIRRYSQMTNVLSEMRNNGLIYGESNAIVGMITLTQKNIPVFGLRAEIERMSEALKRLYQSKKWKDNIIGWAKSLELTYNSERKDFHPHYHILIIWKDKSLSNPEIQELWKRSMRTSYYPQCDIRAAYGDENDLSKIINECLKYNVKQNVNTKPIFESLTVKDFTELKSAMHGKRLVSYGGLIKDYRAKLLYPTEDKDTGIDITIPTEIKLPDTVNDIMLAWSESAGEYKEIERE